MSKRNKPSGRKDWNWTWEDEDRGRKPKQKTGKRQRKNTKDLIRAGRYDELEERDE